MPRLPFFCPTPWGRLLVSGFLDLGTETRAQVAAGGHRCSLMTMRR